MAEPQTRHLPDLLAGPVLSWALVGLSLALLRAVPTFIEVVPRIPAEPRLLAALGLLLLFSAPAVFGLWRLCRRLGARPALAFLFPVVPIATVAFFLVLTAVRKLRR